MELRLDKFISEQKNISRADARKLILKGKVSVDGQAIRSADFKLNPERAEITLFGERVSYREHIYIMLNKPAGVLSAANDKSRETVIDLVPEGLARKNLFPVGRLDKETKGFLIITDDGDFAHYVISPKSGIAKEYKVLLDAPLSEEGAEILRKGVILADGTKCLPARVSINPEDARNVTVEIIEGKYHHIKRSFGVLGLGVDALKRISIAGVPLDESLPEGGCRELTEAEFGEICKNYNINNKKG